MHLDGAENPENSKINHWFASHLPGHRKYYFFSLWNLYCRLRERDRFNVLDRVTPSASIQNGVCIEVGGKCLSWDYLLSAQSVITILEKFPQLIDQKNTILEIGCGWGRIGYFFRKLNPNICYVVSDIPASLLIAQVYLSKLFPTDTHWTYEQVRKQESLGSDNILRGPGFAYIGTHHIPKVDGNSIDLVINTASFQEMELENVRMYFGEINRISKSAYILERSNSDETHFRHYLEMAQHLGWIALEHRKPEFAPNYEEALFGIPKTSGTSSSVLT